MALGLFNENWFGFIFRKVERARLLAHVESLLVQVNTIVHIRELESPFIDERPFQRVDLVRFGQERLESCAHKLNLFAL